MRVICPIKRVPDTAADKKIDPADLTLDRDGSEPVLNANDEWSIEEAMRVKERHGAEVIALCVGPENAQTTIRKALSYGLDGAIQVTDEAISGSDAMAIARVIAAALADEEFDLVIMGNQSSDARTMLVPAMLAEFLGIPALTYARRLELADGTATVDRETAAGHQTVTAALPVVVSVVEAINEPRYPSFKGIMAAKKKPLVTKDLAAIGVGSDEVGLSHSSTQVLEITPRPPKQAGDRVEDDGSGTVGAKALADYLAAQKLI